ncbi:hypothetical protein DFQ05_1851 [Winogradskyella wandonensis]|uniref:Uncharacterized protein n=1 Tax=Winogradskyella wandonensis TaxID=1442586 RepID=A0A4R1KSN8_9FLAO|nr:hypothetical protein [Winogradskyella wandonensis]TCK68066.1 hypothetical protein DFQ05_1851 [Winogradskyella wandonensis]
MNFALFSKLYPNLHLNLIPLKKLGVPSRVFNNWREKGLIDYEHTFSLHDKIHKVKRKNIRLNLHQAMWVLMIKELRALNLDLGTIKQINKQLFATLDPQEMVNHFKEQGLNTINELFPEGDRHYFSEFFNDASLFEKELLSQFKFNPNDFTLMASTIQQILLFGHSPFLILVKAPMSDTFMIDIYNPSFEYSISSEHKSNYAVEFVKGLSENSSLSIPLRPLFSSFLNDGELDKYSEDFGLLTKEEIQLLDIIKDGDFTKIIIHKSPNNTLTIEKNNQADFRGQKVRDLKKMLGLNEYSRVEVVHRNNDHLVVNNKTKYKIDLGKP